MDQTRDDYRGRFDPTWSLEGLSRDGLARLCREYQMLSMFHDRAPVSYTHLTLPTNREV